AVSDRVEPGRGGARPHLIVPHVRLYREIVGAPMHGRHPLVVVLRIHEHGHAQLLHVRSAGGLPRLVPRLGKDREEDGCEYSDDSYQDEQLDDGEHSLAPVACLYLSVTRHVLPPLAIPWGGRPAPVSPLIPGSTLDGTLSFADWHPVFASAIPTLAGSRRSN